MLFCGTIANSNVDKKMGIKHEDIEQLRQLKLLQAANCRRTKPWVKSTGPKTLKGKRKVTQNLPNQGDKIGKAVRNLEKLDEALAKVRRREERSRKRQITALQKLEKLLRKTQSQKSNG